MVNGGLANRLRAIADWYQVATLTNRELIVSGCQLETAIRLSVNCSMWKDKSLTAFGSCLSPWNLAKLDIALSNVWQWRWAITRCHSIGGSQNLSWTSPSRLCYEARGCGNDRPSGDNDFKMVHIHLVFISQVSFCRPRSRRKPRFSLTDDLSVLPRPPHGELSHQVARPTSRLELCPLIDNNEGEGAAQALPFGQGAGVSDFEVLIPNFESLLQSRWFLVTSNNLFVSKTSCQNLESR